MRTIFQLALSGAKGSTSFEPDAIVAFKGVGTSLSAEVTEERDHHRISRQLFLAGGVAQVHDQLLAKHAGDRQSKFRSGALVSAIGLKAGALLRSHLVESHMGIGRIALLVIRSSVLAPILISLL